MPILKMMRFKYNVEIKLMTNDFCMGTGVNGGKRQDLVAIIGYDKSGPLWGPL